MCVPYEKNQRPFLSLGRIHLGHHALGHGDHGIWQRGFALRV